MASKKNKSTTLKERLVSLSTIVTLCTALFTAGYFAGDYQKEMSCILDKTKLQQEYNEKIQLKLDECRSIKEREHTVSKDELESLVKTIISRENGK